MTSGAAPGLIPHITAAGSKGTVAGGGAYGPGGPGDRVADRCATSFPGQSIRANGVVVGRPFMIGQGVRVPIPEGAAALSLGFNDASFAGNRGALKVTVQLPE